MAKPGLHIATDSYFRSANVTNLGLDSFGKLFFIYTVLMTSEINQAIALLQGAQTVAPKDAVGPVTQAIEILVAAIKNPQGSDPDPGGG